MNKDNRNAIIIGLLVTIAFMSVGYALLSTKVDNRGLTASLASKKNRDIRITTISSVETVGNAMDIKSYISGEREITVYPEIMESGDSVIYTVNVANNSNETVTVESIDIDKYVDYTVYTIGNISAGDTINPNESRMFTFAVSYNDSFVGDSMEDIGGIKVRLNFDK